MNLQAPTMSNFSRPTIVGMRREPTMMSGHLCITASAATAVSLTGRKCALLAARTTETTMMTPANKYRELPLRELEVSAIYKGMVLSTRYLHTQ